MVERVSADQAWIPPRADDWNAIAEATEYFQQQRIPRGGFSAAGVIPSTLIRVKNETGGARREGDIAQVGTKLLTDIRAPALWFSGGAVAAPVWSSLHGIFLQATPVNQIDWLQVGGVCLAYVNINATYQRRCGPKAGQATLESAWAGPWEILYAPASTGEQLCVVLLGPKRPSSGIAKLTGDLAAGSTATASSASATLQKRNTSTNALETAGQTVTVWSWFATAFSTNDYLAVAQDDAGDWWLETADCV